MAVSCKQTIAELSVKSFFVIEIFRYFIILLVTRLLSLAPPLIVVGVILYVAVGREFIRIDSVKLVFADIDVQIQSAMLSSFVTLVGIFLSVMFASAQWKKDMGVKRKLDVSSNIVSILYDFCRYITEIAIFAKETRDLIIEADDRGFYDSGYKYSYWMKRRTQVTDYEESLWKSMHEFNCWCNKGRDYLIACGLNSVTMKMSEIVAKIKIYSSSLQIYSDGEHLPNIDFTLGHINMYCIDHFIEYCDRANGYLSINSGRINGILTKDLKVYSFYYLWAMLKIAPSVLDIHTAYETGLLKEPDRLVNAFIGKKKS